MTEDINNDRIWRWNQEEAKRYTGEEAQRMGDEFLMEAAGVDDIDEAIRILRRSIHETDDMEPRETTKEQAESKE